MKKITYAWAAVFLCTVCNAQFFYNDEQQQPAFREPIPPDNTYQYDNNPGVEPVPQAPRAVIPEYEQRPKPNRGRRRESGQRQREIVQLQPPARVYSPSVFGNLALGMPPAGVSIPQDSFLNVLRNDGQDTRTTHNQVYEPSPPQQTSFVQSPAGQSFRASVNSNQYYSSEPVAPRQRGRAIAASPAGIYHQPQIERSQPEFRPNPVQNQAPPAQYQAPPPQRQAPAAQYHAPAPQRQAPAAQYHAPPPQRQAPRAQYQAPPPQRQAPRAQYQAPPPQRQAPRAQYQEPPPQYQAPPAPPQVPLQPQRSSRRRSGTRHRQTSSHEEPQQPPRVYSPSVFENLGLGMAPSGIDVPEDSLLNILRNDRPNSRTRRNQAYPPPPPVAPVVEHAQAQYSSEPHPPVQLEPTDTRAAQQIQAVDPAPRRVNRRPPQQIPRPERVDNSANYQNVEEQPQVVLPVQNRRRVTVRRQHQDTSGRNTNQVELNQPPKQFAPSVFEKFGLGEAPPGIYVPEDSILNLLRGEIPVTLPAPRPVNQRSHIPQHAPAPRRRTMSNIPEAQISPEPDYGVQPEVHSRQDRRSRMSYANQPPPQQQQNVPLQEYQQPVNIQPQREHRRPSLQGIHQPAAPPPRPVEPPRRQRQRSRAQPVSVSQPQPVYEVPQAVYNAGSDLQQEDDILRHRAQDNNQRIQSQGHIPQRKRADGAPRYVPPPEPVYEAPQPTYNVDPSFQEDYIPRRRPPKPSNQRQTQVQQPAQRQHMDSRSPPVQSHHRRDEIVPESRQQPRFKPAKLSVKALPDDTDGDQIPGEAGVDYPTLHVIPKTSFSCAQQPHNGYYADLETDCQVMHMCQAGGVQSSFLCPNGTIFNQEKFSCQWWYKVNCADAPSHYAINDRLYKVPPPPAGRNEE